MKGIITFLLILTCLPAIVSAQPDTTINGIRVIFKFSPAIFPDFWKESPINAEAEPVGVAEIPRCKSMVIEALRKYPPMMLENELKSIYFLKSMKFYDVGYGGTNSNNALYLTNNGRSMGYSDLYLEQTFHHEFSSILYRNHPSFVKEVQWTRTNGEGFEYDDPENGVGAIRNNKSSQELDTALCRKGFLTQYATSGLENDFNTFAQNLFSPTPGFWEIVDTYPRIRKKVKIIIRFYSKVHPVFTMNYFRRLSKP